MLIPYGGLILDHRYSSTVILRLGGQHNEHGHEIITDRAKAFVKCDFFLLAECPPRATIVFVKGNLHSMRTSVEWLYELR